MSENKAIRPKVGIGVYLIRGGKFLVGKRKGAHGEGTYAPPGGHQEHGESFEQTAARELLEETGLSAGNFRFLGLTNDIFDAEKHYITIAIAADFDEAGDAPKLMEPDKCEGWVFVDFDSLPKNKFLAFDNFLKSEFADGLKRELEKSKGE